MTEAEVVRRLRAMYDQSFQRQERSLVPLLFGVKYAEALADYPVKELK